ncbi:MAG: 6-carboxytetrahydropterin synthase [Microcoleaceae cyanobacterium]
MTSARSHYPLNLQQTSTPAYRNILQTSASAQSEAITFLYTIKTTLCRQHFNPPIWQNPHFHDFEITLELLATCNPGDLYGLDMVEVENQLKNRAEMLPDLINEHPLCPHGTTEEMCLYFAQISLDSQIKILQVSVSETPNRVTTLPLHSSPFSEKFSNYK